MFSPVMPTYTRLPISFTHGEGVYLYTTDGTRYLDALSGIAVNSLGHTHPVLSKTIADQAARLMHVSNLYRIEEQERLAARLTELAGMDNVFFCNSGAEANEAAIKLARLYGHQHGHASPKIIVADGSFHGRTLATLSATGNPKIQQGFEPLVDGFVRVPFDDISAIKSAAAKHDDIVAVLIEPIQGEGGIRIPDSSYLQTVSQLCKNHNWLLMLDEVQTGIGRTGKWFAHQHHGIKPDVMTLAKGLGGGMPIGACVAHGKAASVLTAGKHGSTFGGNPLASAAALAVLETIEKESLCENAENIGRLLVDLLSDKLAGNPIVNEIRGQGLMVAIELASPCGELVRKGLDDEQILINVTANSVIRLLPPLILDQYQATDIAQKVTSLIETL